MEWSYYNGEKDVTQELPNVKNSNIRFFHIPKTTSPFPQDDVKAQWQLCDSNTIKGFSSVGYFFGKKLQQDLNVPVGLINASWGGTPAEVWTPAEIVETDSSLKTAAEKLSSMAWWPDTPGVAFNGMLAPVTNYNIAGAIWYQGESNSGTSSTYKKLLTAMIDGWRNAWHKQLPFYYVQIAPYNYGENINGPLLQEAQTQSMSHPNVGMVVITDLIDSVTNIHPSRKKEVGNRLANWALAETYKKNGVVYKNPAFKNAEKKSNKLIVSFDNAPSGLMSKDKSVAGFYIAGDDQQWYPAVAKIEKDKIILSNRKLKDPVYVRYGFGNTLVGNVSSAEGLPLTPFRTDHWEK
jgi:sialate O-acetylesterase